MIALKFAAKCASNKPQAASKATRLMYVFIVAAFPGVVNRMVVNHKAKANPVVAINIPTPGKIRLFNPASNPNIPKSTINMRSMTTIIFISLTLNRHQMV